MIEINLLPQDQRPRIVKSAPSTPGRGFDPAYLLYIVPAVIAILLLAHIYLGAVSYSLQARLGALNREWSGLQDQRGKIDSFKSVSLSDSQDAQVIDELVNKSVRWSRKLNRLSLDLPPGIWFNDISVSRKSLDIKASVFSLEANSVELVNRFLLNLKKDKIFYNDFSSVETGNMLTKKTGSYEVMDFTLSGALKPAAK